MTRRSQRLIVGVLLALGLAAVIIALLMTLPWLLFPLRDAETLRYPGGVTFVHNSITDYSRAFWDAGDWDNPDPCPLGVRHAGEEWDPADLRSPDRLRRLGWTEQEYGRTGDRVTGTSMTSPDGVIKCSYRAGRLTNVSVDAAKAAAPGDLAVGLGGRWVGLPNSAEAIATALGPALPTE